VQRANHHPDYRFAAASQCDNTTTNAVTAGVPLQRSMSKVPLSGVTGTPSRNHAVLHLPDSSDTFGQARGQAPVMYKGFARIPAGYEHDLAMANKVAQALLARGQQMEMLLRVSPCENDTT